MTVETKKYGKVQGTAAFSKGIAVLQLIADAPSRPTMSELLAASGLTRPTLHRLLKALQAEGLVEMTPNRTYQMGSRLIQFAGRALQQNDLARAAEPEMERLREITSETVHLAVRSGMEIVYLMKKESPQAVRLGTSVGGRVPMHASAVGKCILAFLPVSERNAVLEDIKLPRLTKFTPTSINELVAQLKKIRQDGYCRSDQESILHVCCFGAPIFNGAGDPIGGLSISVPLFRIRENIQEYLVPLLSASEQVSRSLAS